MPTPDTRSRSAPPRRWLRVGAALAVVLGLHTLAVFWLTRHRETFTPLAPAEVPVQIELLKPQPIERKPAPAAPRTAKPAVSRPAPTGRASQAPASTSTQTADGSVSPPASAPGARHAAAGDADGGAVPEPASSGVKFSTPPPGDLQYDTFFNGVKNSTGTIRWRTDGQTYDLSVTMPVPFIGPFSYRSTGRIDAFGIAPDRYVEQRGKRPEDIAIFNRDMRQIVFTRTPDSLPLPDGAQDRFSMLMQLAGLVRGDPDAYRPGVTRQFFVVDNNNGETWPIAVIGDENVQTSAGFIAARHFMRLPRRSGDTRRIDMWLAPALGWLPARLVQTEPNGSQIELLWHGRLASPDAPADAAPGDGNATPGMPAPETPAATRPDAAPANPTGEPAP